MKGLKEPLLFKPAIKALKLLARVNEVTAASTEDKVKNKYPQLFHGLGAFEGEYEIKIKPDAKPFVIITPRRVPLAMKPKVKEELAWKNWVSLERSKSPLTGVLGWWWF